MFNFILIEVETKFCWEKVIMRLLFYKNMKKSVFRAKQYFSFKLWKIRRFGYKEKPNEK